MSYNSNHYDARADEDIVCSDRDQRGVEETGTEYRSR